MIHQFLNVFAAYKIKKKQQKQQRTSHRPSGYYDIVSGLLGTVMIICSFN